MKFAGRTCVVLLACMASLALSGTACVTKSQAKAEARAAFEAGQRQAMESWRQHPGPTVVFNGPVQNPLVPWTPGLTLAKGLLESGYTSPHTPSEIYIVRRGRAFQVDPGQLLRGEDVPLEAGDIIEVRALLPNAVRP